MAPLDDVKVGGLVVGPDDRLILMCAQDNFPDEQVDELLASIVEIGLGGRAVVIVVEAQSTSMAVVRTPKAPSWPVSL